MNVDELQVFDWKTIAIVENGEKTFHKSETGWDIDTGFNLTVDKVKDNASV